MNAAHILASLSSWDLVVGRMSTSRLEYLEETLQHSMAILSRNSGGIALFAILKRSLHAMLLIYAVFLAC